MRRQEKNLMNGIKEAGNKKSGLENVRGQD